jgi:hypothetical protein
MINKQDINEVANSFLSYEEMYELLNNGNFKFLSRELSTNRYPQIEWMIEYFENKEQYEKCHFLSKLQILN